MKKTKYSLLIRVTEQGLIKLIDDLERLYEKHRPWNRNIEIRLRKSEEFGPYQVNILTEDFDEMFLRSSEHQFLKQYREDDK